MASSGGGLLAMLGGAGAGMAGAVQEQEKTARESAIEEKKQQALYLKQQNLARLNADLQSQGRAEQNKWNLEQSGSGFYQDGHEITKAEYAAMDEASRTNLMTTQGREEYTSNQELKNRKDLASFEMDGRKDLIAMELQGRKDLEALRHGFAMAENSVSRNAAASQPSELEKKYQFLANTLGEEKAKELILSSMTKTGASGNAELDTKKLWNKVYNDELQTRVEADFDNKVPFEEKQAAAMASANQVTGLNLGGANNNAGSMLDTYLGKVKKQPAGESVSAQNQQSIKPKGILAQGVNTDADVPASKMLPNNDTFKKSMGAIAEQSGMTATEPVKKAIQISQGVYNPDDQSVTFKPKNEDDLKKKLIELNKQGVLFDAKYDKSGNVVINVNSSQPNKIKM